MSDPPLANPRSKPRGSAGKWTRAEKTSACALGIALIAGAGTVWNSSTNRQNYNDNHANFEQSHLNEQIDTRVNQKIHPFDTELQQRKTADQALRDSIDGVGIRLKEGLESIKGEMVKSNDLIRGAQQEVATMSGRMGRLEKNVDQLLERQIRGTANLPVSALAAQIPNLKFLYQLASERHVEIPSETNSALRLKLASMETSEADFWPLASAVISRASIDLIGGNLQTTGTITSTYTNNIFTGMRVILDNIRFTNNVCDRCIIEYHGGPTDVRRCAFTNSLFIIVIRGPLETPSPDGQKIIRTLLASNLQSVKFGAN